MSSIFGKMKSICDRIYSVGKKVILHPAMIYSLLVFSVLNATLRFTESGMTTLFRILAPFVFLFVICSDFKAYKKDIMVILIAIAYSVVVSLVFYQHIAVNMLAFLMYLFALYVFMKHLLRTDTQFEKNFWNFINTVTICTLILCWIQYFNRVAYPYLELAADPGVNVFMSNENELAEPLCCMLIIYLFKVLFQRKWQYLLIAVNILFFTYINDAKMCLIGATVGICLLGLFYLYTVIRKKSEKAGKVYAIGVPTLFVVGLMLLIIVNPSFKFRDYSISVDELVFDNIRRIIMLDLIEGSGGSMMDRTNAIIYGLMELRRSKFFGIGWGNSVTMLAMPEFHLATAKSMHNIIMQFLVEFGFLAIFVYYKIVRWLISAVKRINENHFFIAKIVFAASFIFFSSQSSVGILSNYYTWIVVFYLFLITGEYHTTQGERKKALWKRSAR